MCCSTYIISYITSVFSGRLYHSVCKRYTACFIFIAHSILLTPAMKNLQELTLYFPNSSHQHSIAHSTYSQLLSCINPLLITPRDRVVVLAILSYCTFGFAVIGFDEVFPIWAATSRSLGGLGFSLHEIGIAMAIVGAVLLPFSMFLYAGVSTVT